MCIHDAEALDRALDGVYLDLAAVALQPGASFVTTAEWLGRVWDRRELGGAEVSGSLGADPIAALAAEGVLPQGLEVALSSAAELAESTAAATPRVRTFTVDLGPYAEAGASPAAQLGALLSTGVSYLRAMTAAGIGIDTAAGQIDATIVLDADYFGGSRCVGPPVGCGLRCWASVAPTKRRRVSASTFGRRPP